MNCRTVTGISLDSGEKDMLFIAVVGALQLSGRHHQGLMDLRPGVAVKTALAIAATLGTDYIDLYQ